MTARACLRGIVGLAGVLCMMLIAAPAMAQQSTAGCERGILDDGEDGMNVLVYELCSDRMTVGFENSDVIEEITCGSSGDVRLWMSANPDRCPGLPDAETTQVHDLMEPLRGIGRTTTAPVAKRLTCDGTTNHATITVPNARAALLETRGGDTKYERITRRFIAQCDLPIM